MSGTTVNPYRFGGQLGYRRDSPVRQYVRARHLDTAKGRWTSRDPVSIVTADFNLYWYGRNSPTGLVDPSGAAPTAFGQRKPPPRKPSCPPGYKLVFITGYGDNAGCVGKGCDVAYYKQCDCDSPRLPQSGDCAIDQNNPVCQPGQYIDIIKKNGTHTNCRACDAGQGHGGLDIKVPGKNNIRNVDKYWTTGHYCVKCSEGKPQAKG